MSEILRSCAEKRVKARGLVAYEIKAKAPIASNTALKFGEYSPGAVTFRTATWIPGTTFFGLAMRRALATPEEPIGRYYPALPAFSDGGGTFGILACEKSKCLYADFCTASAFEGPQRADLPRPMRVVGIYFDRMGKTAKYGKMYSYQLHPSAVFVTASTAELPEQQRLGYKKGYGWGEAEAAKLCEAEALRSNAFVFTAPVPFTAFLNALRAEVESLDGKLGRWAYYLQVTNKFYIVGNSPSELYLAPLSRVILKNKMSPLEVWDLLAEEIKRLKVFKMNGVEARPDEAECVRLKASATVAAPLAAHD